ncbi:MAG: hypothetical protein EZS28_033880 [Streblomastix strix]|uniref:Uncharacterized protein n=1 Tax=Streblomastix strix TaxID=222440 RepID=A0A5J4UK36_9EUKA|nr:MAG: hypothetical protein EZS28_033880 [Streblomastix strix]
MKEVMVVEEIWMTIDLDLKAFMTKMLLSCQLQYLDMRDQYYDEQEEDDQLLEIKNVNENDAHNVNEYVLEEEEEDGVNS